MDSYAQSGLSTCTMAVSLVSAESPFGIDEFGRGHLHALLWAAAWSIARGLYMAMLLFALATMLVVLVEVRKNKLLGDFLSIVIAALESVPIYVWVLAGVSWAPQHADTMATLIFVTAGLPLIFNALQGIVRQITRQLYYQAAIALGSGDWHLVRYHVLPNALPHCTPLIVYVVGAAIAIYGGIGVFGFINRRELDIGVFLLRGREQVGFDATVLILTLMAYLGIFLLLNWTKERARHHLNAKTSWAHIALTRGEVTRHVPKLPLRGGIDDDGRGDA